MAKYSIEGTTLTNIAGALRSLLGVSGGMTPEEMAESVSGISKVAVPTPSVSVSSSGLITASAKQSAGYTPGGTKSATKQLTTTGAKTVTPGSTEQTVVKAGTYVTGDIKVSAAPSGGGGGGGNLQYCIISNYYYIGNTISPSVIVYFEDGWTWGDFVASQYNKYIPGTIKTDIFGEGNTGYYPAAEDTQPTALLALSGNDVVAAYDGNAMLYYDYEGYGMAMRSSKITAGYTYHFGY